ncbi:MAG: 2'-5' RNA ligase family protein [Candidatus Saccharimonadales bacterium]
MVQKRWFIGVTLPDELSDAISGVQQQLKQNDVTLLEPIVPHITLLHPNPLMELSPLYFAPIAKQATDTLLPCDIQLTATSTFRSDVLYISVESPQLHKIYNALVEALPHAVQSSYFVGKEFVPHITIAQAKSGCTLNQNSVQIAEQQLRGLLPASFIASELTRFESNASRSYSVKKL